MFREEQKELSMMVKRKLTVPMAFVCALLLTLSAGCTRTPRDESSDPAGWVRVEIDKTYSLARPKEMAQSRYGHPEGSVELFKTDGLELHAALVYEGVDQPARTVEEPNAVIDGRQVHIQRFRREPDPRIAEALGMNADFGDVGDARRTLQFMAYCRDTAAQDLAETIVRSIRFAPMRPEPPGPSPRQPSHRP